jgi:hypothetical protein
MASTHTNLLFHIVYSTKYHRNTITPEYRQLLVRHGIEFDEQYLFEEEQLA